MYTSEIKRTNYLKIMRNYLIISALVGVFSAAYECFSHEVYSLTMILAFSPSLFLGAAPAALLHLLGDEVSSAGRRIFRLGTACLTVGMIFNGVIEIYGTDSPLTKYYFIAASALFVTGFSLILIKCFSRSEN